MFHADYELSAFDVWLLAKSCAIEIIMALSCSITAIKVLVEHPVKLWTTILEFVFTLVICTCGVSLNIKFSQKLEQERRCRPVGRKGNVIEPIMRWFIKLQIVYWPFELFVFWMVVNDLLPCSTYPQICFLWGFLITCGRLIVAFNSIMLALIRYLYIVYSQKANQWEFNKVARWFQIASIAVPFSIHTVWCLTFDRSFFIQKLIEKFYTKEDGASNTTFTECTDVSIAFTSQYLPKPFIDTVGISTMIVEAIAYLNIAECFFYAKIFQTIQR